MLNALLHAPLKLGMALAGKGASSRSGLKRRCGALALPPCRCNRHCAQGSCGRRRWVLNVG